MFGGLIGVLMLLVGVVSVFNALLGLELALEVSGSEVALPRFLDGALGAIGVGVAILGVSAAGSLGLYWMRRTKSWPLRIGMMVLAAAVVSAASYGGYWLLEWQIFGSWAVACAANGSTEAMIAHLDADPDEELAQDCLDRAIQFGHAETVGALLHRGVSPEKRYEDGEVWCMLEDADDAILEVAAVQGWSEGCERDPG